MVRPLLLIAGLLILETTPLYAGGSPTVGILDFSGEGVSREHLGVFRDLLSGLLPGKEVRVLPADEVLRGIRGESFSPSAAREVREARASLARGKDAYENLRFDEAVRELTRAVRDLEGRLDALEGLSPLEEAHLYLGLAYQARGEEERALRELERTAAIDPDRQLDEASFPPSVVAAYERARQGVQVSSTAELFVDTTPPLAYVYLDGRRRGMSPLTIKNVPPGVHQVAAEKAGFRRMAVAAEGGRPGGVVMALTSLDGERAYEAIRGILAGGFPPGEEDAVGANIPALAGSLGAEYVVLTVLRPMVDAYRSLLLVYDGRQGKVLYEEEADLSPDPREMEAALRRITGTIRPLLVPIREGDWDIAREGGAPRGNSGWYRSWKVWASVGGTFLVASGALFFGAQSAARDYGDQVDSYNRYVSSAPVVDPAVLKSSRDRAESYRSQYMVYMTWGAISLGTSAIFLGVSGYLAAAGADPGGDGGSTGPSGSSSPSLAILPRGDGAHLVVSVPF